MWRLVIGADVVRSLRDLNGLRLPQAEGIDRAGRPMPAGRAVAIAHRVRLTTHCELNGPAKATAPVTIFLAHVYIPDYCLTAETSASTWCKYRREPAGCSDARRSKYP